MKARVTSNQAKQAVGVLVDYFENSELSLTSDITMLNGIARRVNAVAESSSVQRAITHYFK